MNFCEKKSAKNDSDVFRTSTTSFGHHAAYHYPLVEKQLMKSTPTIFTLTLMVTLTAPMLRAQERRDRFKQWDKNNDGKLTFDELPEPMRETVAKFDSDGDGKFTRDEFTAFSRNRTRSPRPENPTPTYDGEPTELPVARNGTSRFEEDDRATQKYSDLLPEDLKDKVIVKAKVYFGDKELQYVNAFLLKSDEPTPVILTYHGGGWAKGMPTSNAAFRDGSEFINYLRAGMSWVDVGYSLTGAAYSRATRTKDPAHWPVQGRDAVAGVQLVRHMAEQWNVDPDRIAITGVSAGGHLAMWVAFSDDQADPDSDDPLRRQSSRVACVICMGAPVDFRWFDIPTLAESEDSVVAGREEGLSHKDLATCLLGLFGCTAEEFDKTEASKRNIDDANLLNKIDEDDPPALLVFQRKDPSVPTYPKHLTNPHSYWNGVALQRRFSEVGIELDYKGGADWATKFNFLKQHLGLEGTAEPNARRRRVQQ